MRMTVPEGRRATVAVALTQARRARLDVAAALERISAVGAEAWEGRQAEVWQRRMRRLAAEAAMALDRCVQACETALQVRETAFAPAGPGGPRKVG
ncbi:hypothetical protein [Frankia casuarinae]|nr:hypothetical protein [Frankia casuarinae]